MAFIKMNSTPINATQSEKRMARKGVHFDSKFVVDAHGDGVLQSCSKRRRYMRRGSKSASMFKMAAHTVQEQYDLSERVLLDIRGSPTTNKRLPATQSHEKPLGEPLKFYSTESLIDELAFLEKLLSPTAPKTTKIVLV